MNPASNRAMSVDRAAHDQLRVLPGWHFDIPGKRPAVPIFHALGRIGDTVIQFEDFVLQRPAGLPQRDLPAFALAEARLPIGSCATSTSACASGMHDRLRRGISIGGRRFRRRGRGVPAVLPIRAVVVHVSRAAGSLLGANLLFVFNPPLRRCGMSLSLPFSLGPPLRRHLFFALPGGIRAPFRFSLVMRLIFRLTLRRYFVLPLSIIRRALKGIADDGIRLIELLHAAIRFHRLIFVGMILKGQPLIGGLHNLWFGGRIDLQNLIEVSVGFHHHARSIRVAVTRRVPQFENNCLIFSHQPSFGAAGTRGPGSAHARVSPVFRRPLNPKRVPAHRSGDATFTTLPPITSP